MAAGAGVLVGAAPDGVDTGADVDGGADSGEGVAVGVGVIVGAGGAGRVAAADGVGSGSGVPVGTGVASPEQASNTNVNRAAMMSFMQSSPFWTRVSVKSSWPAQAGNQLSIREPRAQAFHSISASLSDHLPPALRDR